MKKNQESDVGKASGVVWKMWLTMKLLFCFLLIGFSTVYGNAFSQVKISISVNEVSLQEVFEKLTEQTGYHFVYSNEMLQRTGKVSVDMQNCDLGQIMAVCLKNTGLWYRLEDNIIVISPKFRQPDVHSDSAGGIGTDACIFVCGDENARSSLKRSASVTYCHAGRCVSNGRSYRYRLPGSQERENDRGGNHHLLRKT